MGGIILYLRADIPSNLLAFEDKPIESLFVERNLQNTEILISCSYNPHKSEIKKHLTALRNSSDLHSSKYEKILILGDFSMEIEGANKNRNKPACADLILTNVPRMFQSTCLIEIGLSDFHLMKVTVIRKTFKKMRPRVINYRSFRDFSDKEFVKRCFC